MTSISLAYPNFNSERLSMAKVTIYDPPSGWMYGFPKEYKPLPGEPFEDTLVRDGYPRSEAEFASKYCRWWTQEEEE